MADEKPRDITARWYSVCVSVTNVMLFYRSSLTPRNIDIICSSRIVCSILLNTKMLNIYYKNKNTVYGA